MKIITWNINSIRIRLDLIKELIQRENPDVICLQETKVPDEFFPFAIIKSMGYQHIAFVGEKSYNGVAIIAKIPFILREHLSLVNNDARHISVILPGEIELHNFYVPAGGDIPDRLLNNKFDHKIKYCEAMAKWFINERCSQDKIILVGDLNIAPMHNDVWSHKQLLSVVSHTPIEVESLANISNSIGFVDVVRKFVPETEKLYSWWSYRNRDWRKSNRGRRLDHIWVTRSLDDMIKSSSILQDARDWSRPSDHVPVILELN